MVSFFAKVKIFRFWPKTMDYNKAFLPKSRCFSAVLLLHSGSQNFTVFGRKPWTIIRHFETPVDLYMLDV